ncbi:STAS domain-containing protein [Kitasatospora sp. NPDC093679]|uniref:STAS domain-containing protein n=1 Tax=Kitasatospora sp. NPDC093679 TaxID=3154983 RepID=UPI0034211A57
MPGDLKTNVERVGPVAVCSLAGDLHMDNQEEVRAALKTALGLLPEVLAVDLTGAELFTSSGLNALLRARLDAADRFVPLVLITPSRAVRRVLAVTEAQDLFPICATAEEAARYAPTNRAPGG